MVGSVKVQRMFSVYPFRVASPKQDRSDPGSTGLVLFVGLRMMIFTSLPHS
jgi:hypothetical protein